MLAAVFQPFAGFLGVVLEKTGRPTLWIGDLLGISEEYFPARDKGYAIFHMMVRYYPCRVKEAQALYP